jgi:hypothetical protein
LAFSLQVTVPFFSLIGSSFHGSGFFFFSPLQEVSNLRLRLVWSSLAIADTTGAHQEGEEETNVKAA